MIKETIEERMKERLDARPESSPKFLLTTNVIISQTSVLPIPALLFLAILALYLLTRTHLNTFDAVAYANQMGLAAQTGKLRPLFHPHHLLFNALGYGLWQMARRLGYGGGPLVVTQILNAVLGALGLTVYFLTLRRLRPQGGLALPITLGVAGSFGYWICATDGRVNMAHIALLIAAFDALVRFQHRPAARQAAWAGLLAGLAVLFHESAGLFVAVGAAGMWGPAAGSIREKLRTRLLPYLAAWAAAVMVPYLLVAIFALHLHSLTEFHHWANAYAERGWWWDFHLLHNLRLDLFGLRHAVFVQPLGRAALAQNPLGPLGKGALALLWLLYLGSLTGLSAAGAALAAALRQLWRSEQKPLLRVCLLWIGVYGAFFTVWCPGAFVFWTPVLIPLGAWLTLALPRRRLPLLAAWIGAFTMLNFLAGILPYLKPIAGLSQRVAVDIRQHTPPRALIVVAGVGDAAQCEVDIPYFGNRPILSLHGLLAHTQTLPEAQGSLEQSLDKAFGAGRAVYVPEELWTHRDCVKGLQKQSPTLTGPALQAMFAAYSPVLAWNGPRGLVWRLSPRARPGRRTEAARRTGLPDDRRSDTAERSGAGAR